MMVSIHWNLLFQGAPIFRWTMFVLGGCMDKGSPIPLLRGTSPVLQALKKTPHRSRVLDWNNRIITGKLGNVPSSETRWFEQMKNLNVSFHFLKSYESIRTLKDQHCYPLPFLKRSTIRSIFFFFKFWGSRWTFPIFFPTPKHQQKSHCQGIRFVWKSRKPGQFKYRPSEFVLICFWILKSAIWLLMVQKSCTSWGTVVCPIIYRVLAPSQVVVWDFSHQQDHPIETPVGRMFLAPTLTPTMGAMLPRVPPWKLGKIQPGRPFQCFNYWTCIRRCEGGALGKETWKKPCRVTPPGSLTARPWK